jgi:hypothetical protein
LEELKLFVREAAGDHVVDANVLRCELQSQRT